MLGGLTNKTMTNEQKAEEISARYSTSRIIPNKEEAAAYDAAMQMAEWKDERASELIDLLLDAIDHAYLQTNGSYGDLALEVADKVEYLKTIRYEREKPLIFKGDA